MGRGKAFGFIRLADKKDFNAEVLLPNKPWPIDQLCGIIIARALLVSVQAKRNPFDGWQWKQWLPEHGHGLPQEALIAIKLGSEGPESFISKTSLLDLANRD